MSVYKDEEKGTWYCKFRYTDWTGKPRSTTKRGFRTKREAKQFEVDFKRTSNDTPDMTVGELCKLYMSQYRTRMKETSAASIQYMTDMYIAKYLDGVKLSELTKSRLMQWQDYVMTLGKSAATVKKIDSRMRAMLAFAEKMDYIQKNPMRSIGGIGENTKRKEFWTIDQYIKFTKAGQGSKSYDVIRLCFDILFYSGMRLGEFQAIRYDSIDFEKNTITVSAAKNYLGKITSPKNQHSKRIIHMPPSIIKRIKEYCDSLYDIPDGELFRISRRQIGYYLRKWSEAAGIKPIVAHSLRHSHASYLIKLGVPITAISRRLGHASPKVTLDVYSHMYEDDASSVADILQREIDVGQSVVNKENKS